jgi:crotonobetainyl-CoA:carnitine CoA-transferase CaiB-like acyl-CoA transferase
MPSPIPDTEPEGTASMRALAHLRVVDLTTDVAGPYATKLFVDAGAEVIKIEPATGDPLRGYSATGAELGGRDGALFQFLNGGKRSIVGRFGDDQVQALLGGADLLVDDTATVDVAETRARWPHLVVLSITPFGLDGPYAGRPATEFTIQAESGSILYRGRPTREPVTAGGRLAEFMSGAYAAPAALAAVLRARRTGVGEHIDLSMTDVMAVAASIYADLIHHMVGRPALTTPARSLETPSIEKAKDGYVGFNTNTGQMFQNFLLMIDRPDLLDDKELASFGGRVRRPDWPGIMSAWMLEHTVDEIVELASALRIPVTPVYDGASILGNEHLAARGAFVENPGGFRQPRTPYRLDNLDPPAPKAAPALDADRGSVLARPTPVPTEPTADAHALPLAGLRVLDLTAWWAGPSATQFLALLGAEVVHVEGINHPDGMRTTGYVMGREKWWEWSHVFAAVNTDKLGITLDLAKPAGRELCVKLIEWADVVTENFSPRVMEHWGLDADAMRAINPNVIYTRMPAFGLSGPWRDRVGFAQTMEQMTMASITGYPDDAPLIPKGPCDPNAGMHGAWAMLVALALRARDGRGVLVEATMIEAALNVCPLPVIEYTAYGSVMGRTVNRVSTAAPQGIYAGEGYEQWLALSIETDEQWRSFVEFLGAPAWAADPALATHSGRLADHDRLDRQIVAWAEGRDVAALADELAARGVPAARCSDPRLQSRHVQMVARGLYETVVHPEVGAHPVPGLPLRYASVAHWLHRPAPLLGEHNAEVLGRVAGVDAERLACLEAEGIVSTRPKGQ